MFQATEQLWLWGVRFKNTIQERLYQQYLAHDIVLENLNEKWRILS